MDIFSILLFIGWAVFMIWLLKQCVIGLLDFLNWFFLGSPACILRLLWSVICWLATSFRDILYFIIFSKEKRKAIRQARYESEHQNDW
jgi:hypothetical protein